MTERKFDVIALLAARAVADFDAESRIQRAIS
jgi:hypothetical protein